MLRYVILIFFLFSSAIFANEANLRVIHPCYFGLSLGYGSTTWAQLVPPEENQNFAMRLAAPVEVTEGGFVWGGFLGFEFSDLFALEANYTHYPSVNIIFDSSSIFSFLNNGTTNFHTHTETMNLMAKFMLYIANTGVRAFSSLGIAGLHRRDLLVDQWRLCPTFGTGINFKYNERYMFEILGNFTAGYGESQINPTAAYFPFLYAVMFRFSYFI